ncbi:ABC transporter permease [Cyclobacterium marinum]|uniref:ABC transporter permease n=1 Tax=Cyclobacterium marinum (strain ATCC 25205 / DSM 745 / LMG 13164 / NCIMB 1802) TaxID=880070 RepID=G0J3C7_CYCMS|nr:ABC transporter permease subunit [Cyclobacterium marinum]AEL24068.1 ABC transporter permease [Cyclobacterium marinum DSM 745]
MKGIINALDNNASVRDEKQQNPFWILVRKEVAGHIRSWRFIILLVLVVLTFWGATAVAMNNIKDTVAKVKDLESLFLYLKILTTTEGTLPPFHVFLNFLGPLLGISLGFDAINSEQQNGTLTRIMAQPIYRDNLLLSKFVSSLLLVGTLLLALSLLMVGGGMLLTGVMIEVEELIRILCFMLLCTVYVGFWLGLSILLSIVFKQASTSALTAIGIWLFFTVFYQIVVNMVVTMLTSGSGELTQMQVMHLNEIILNILRLAPSQLYADATTTLLMPSVRSLGPVTMEQMAGAIPSPLSIRDSLLIVWPQLTGLLAATLLCFAFSYYLFMRREIRT